MKVGIIGGGIAGLTAAYYLSQKHVEVTLFEKEAVLGGLASSFLLDGNHIEKYYHFICLGDKPLLHFLNELGLGHHLRWVNTEMGLFYNRHLYSFSEPLDLLMFPGFTLLDKLKFGWGIICSKTKNRDDWKDLEHVPAPEWLIRQFGPNSYRIVHKPLIELKFGSYASRLSAAWIWARIHRVGKSRTKITQKEKLGYIDGGTHVLINRLEKAITENGGHVLKNMPIQRIMVENNRATGVVCNGQAHAFDVVISTIPSVMFLQLVSGLSNDYLYKLSRIESIGVICMFLRLKKRLTKYFWTNLSDPRISLAGAIEYTNLNPCPHLNGDRIVYLPQYLPSSSKRYLTPDEEFLQKYTGYLSLINPAFSWDWIKDYFVFRDEYAQPVCEVGFSKLVPSIDTPIAGLYMTDSCQLHPEDRTVANSIGLGKRAAALVIERLDTA